MLEIVPKGVDKWVGMQKLLAHLEVPRTAVMAGEGVLRSPGCHHGEGAGLDALELACRR